MRARTQQSDCAQVTLFVRCSDAAMPPPYDQYYYLELLPQVVREPPCGGLTVENGGFGGRLRSCCAKESNQHRARQVAEKGDVPSQIL